MLLSSVSLDRANLYVTTVPPGGLLVTYEILSREDKLELNIERQDEHLQFPIDPKAGGYVNSPNILVKKKKKSLNIKTSQGSRSCNEVSVRERQGHIFSPEIPQLMKSEGEAGGEILPHVKMRCVLHCNRFQMVLETQADSEHQKKSVNLELRTKVGGAEAPQTRWPSVGWEQPCLSLQTLLGQSSSSLLGASEVHFPPQEH